MRYKHFTQTSLFTPDKRRKYLTQEECKRFVQMAEEAPPLIRTLCLLLVYTGCRISEALGLTTHSIELHSAAVAIYTLKQRDKQLIRVVPLPKSFIESLEDVHNIHKQQLEGEEVPLWPWHRVQAWRHVKGVMKAAKVHGSQACPRGLRHSYGIRNARKGIPPRILQNLMGHAEISTTMIYTDFGGSDVREYAARGWDLLE